MGSSVPSVAILVYAQPTAATTVVILVITMHGFYYAYLVFTSS